MGPVDFDPSDQGANEISLAMPVKVGELLPDLGRKFFEPADDQGQLTFRRDRIESGLPALPELRQAAFEAGDAGLELATLDHPLGIAVDQTADTAL
jgi:hypothetical protein